MSEPIVTPETRRLLLVAPVALLVWSALYFDLPEGVPVFLFD